jgi:hypothetical protein
MTVDERAIVGARNNADWYETVFAAHGLRYERLPYAFVGYDPSPRYYSDLTVLAPDQTDPIVTELAKSAARFGGNVGVKDSFCQLELEDNGFQPLFSASWIWRAGQSPSMLSGWTIVCDPGELIVWEEDWKRNGSPTDNRMFPEAILDRQDTFFLGRKSGSRFEAGCIANLSDDCIGLSNVFADIPSEKFFAEAANAAASIGEDHPVVGYESGKDLDYAISAGFRTVGRLRILASKDAKF